MSTGLGKPEYPDRALILGGARGVWQDVLALEEMLGESWKGWVIAVNDVGVHWPRHLHHWVSLHPAKFPGWESTREHFGFSLCARTWGPTRRFTTDQIEPWPNMSSAGLAVQVAKLTMGETGGRGILCGVPLTRTPHFEESQAQHLMDKDGNWAHADKHWKAWSAEERAKTLRPWLRSMSGRTRELLGAPTRDWLLGGY